MVKKISVHLDAIIAIVAVIFVSFGINIYQRFQYSSLLKEHVEVSWHAQDMETNWNYVKALLEQCRANGAGHEASPSTQEPK